jgi:hypothetical protein
MGGVQVCKKYLQCFKLIRIVDAMGDNFYNYSSSDEEEIVFESGKRRNTYVGSKRKHMSSLSLPDTITGSRNKTVNVS